MSDVRQELAGLLNYVEQIVRQGERACFRLSDYRLPDGSTFALLRSEAQTLPGLRFDAGDEDGPVWLEVERLSADEPPVPPKVISDLIAVSTDPTRPPDIRDERPAVAAASARYMESWTAWSAAELSRRRTAALYDALDNIRQLVDAGEADNPIELIWGIGVVRWRKDKTSIDRPLLDRRVEIERDDEQGGLLRIRPTSAEAHLDLKPYEELGCKKLPALATLVQRHIRSAGKKDGVSPFARDSFEPILSAVAPKLDPNGVYEGEAASAVAADSDKDNRLTVTDEWVLFARPRSSMALQQDIDRLRQAALKDEQPIEGFPQHLVTEPPQPTEAELQAAAAAPIDWSSHGEDDDDDWDEEEFMASVGTAAPRPATQTGAPTASEAPDAFFPKPFNDDQIEISRRLSRTDGLVVLGPPGTGKTQTIANLICHAMAMGQRVLVVSRAEAALAALRDQLPAEVRSLAVAMLANERAGLRQIAGAIHDIQKDDEGTLPGKRRAAIARLELELGALQSRIHAIDGELDKLALAHLSKMGPHGETPAELAPRIEAERDFYRWFVDRPMRFTPDAGFADEDLAALKDARRRIGDYIDHSNARLPSPADLPDAETIVSWHNDLIAAEHHHEDAERGPVEKLRVRAYNISEARNLAKLLDGLAGIQQMAAAEPWIERYRDAVIDGLPEALSRNMQAMIAEFDAFDRRCARLPGGPVDLPDGLLDNSDAIDAVSRAAVGQRLWPMTAMGRRKAKALVAAIRINGAVVDENDSLDWMYVSQAVTNALCERELNARWVALVRETGAVLEGTGKKRAALSRNAFRICDRASRMREALALITTDSLGIEELAQDHDLCTGVAKQLRAAAQVIELAGVEQQRRELLEEFQGEDRTSALARQFLSDVVGHQTVPDAKIAAVWARFLQRLDQLKAFGREFAIIERVTGAIASADAPIWARQLSTEKAADGDPAFPSDWREAWDHAAALVNLDHIDAQDKITLLADERAEAEKNSHKIFGSIIRERAFYQLDLRRSPAIKEALAAYTQALTQTAHGAGKSAAVRRRKIRDALAKCHDAVPCWIMPTWRVAEQIPAAFGAFDLVIVEDASQSDLSELPALMRGKKILVIGDDRRVSPPESSVPREQIDALRERCLGDVPAAVRNVLEPGECIYNLIRAAFPNEQLMLKEHFRSVEPIIRFSMQFYPEKMLPLRIPAAQDRLDPPLVDIYVPHGTEAKDRRINAAEADVIVDDIRTLTARPDMAHRSIGIISLDGPEQADHIRARLMEAIGAEAMARHRILCGDSAAFQHTQRDIVYLSMVACPATKTAPATPHGEQNFNVAVSSARDRLVLVRSIRRDRLEPDDLKARLIAHFEDPIPDAREHPDALSACETGFERDLMERLLKLGYRVESQVGPAGCRIDMVVEGQDGTRLAIECDGDRSDGSYRGAEPGPEQWRDSMRRQRALERAGWRFWRCFAATFHRNTDAVMADLIATLSRLGIEPQPSGDVAPRRGPLTEHRTIAARHAASEATTAPDLADAPVSSADAMSDADADV